MSAPSDLLVEPTTNQERGFTAWPLWLALTGLLGVASTVAFDKRVDADGDFDYPVTVADMADLDHLFFRIGGFTGYLTVIAMLVTAAVWRQRVERRHPWSVGATVVTFGLVSAAGAMALVYGWKGALGNYLHGAAEENTYDDQGLYVLYNINDFGPYFAWLPVLVAALGLAYMAFREGLVSKVLGFFAGLMAVLLLGMVAVTGVPGLPALISVGVLIAGIWLAVGRSAITQEEK
ncbi:hypothetical protein EFK50_10060 [Nocardioides marmoriginsengisoli]|uniref:DUF4386 family protein n=1 Tax=Nocardioides marmoriginsengisoli TaxID=661483 RepID=A0A3N0CFC1_9ACTN|nr:DUF4386 family protein [Nocardioides marmoriginsengisoli]RNL62138.1 hypothetical protein EFK50_10060 [Nocardioides marmoriginsengisoli]